MSDCIHNVPWTPCALCTLARAEKAEARAAELEDRLDVAARADAQGIAAAWEQTNHWIESSQREARRVAELESALDQATDQVQRIGKAHDLLADALDAIEGGHPCSEDHRAMARAALRSVSAMGSVGNRDGGNDHQETSSIPENTPKNTDKQMELLSAVDRPLCGHETAPFPIYVLADGPNKGRCVDCFGAGGETLRLRTSETVSAKPCECSPWTEGACDLGTKCCYVHRASWNRPNEAVPPESVLTEEAKRVDDFLAERRLHLKHADLAELLALLRPDYQRGFREGAVAARKLVEASGADLWNEHQKRSLAYAIDAIPVPDHRPDSAQVAVLVDDGLYQDAPHEPPFMKVVEPRPETAVPDTGAGPLAVLLEALRAWDALFVWTEPFEGYDEEMAVHRALALLTGSGGAT